MPKNRLKFLNVPERSEHDSHIVFVDPLAHQQADLDFPRIKSVDEQLVLTWGRTSDAVDTNRHPSLLPVIYD